MLEAMLTHLHNWFPARNGKHAGAFVIASGTLSTDIGLIPGQYYRICGSVMNDGLHQAGNPDDILMDERFTGEVWALAIPRAVQDMAEGIAKWRESNPVTDKTSESFAGYSYSRAQSASGGVGGWQAAFSGRLNAWRRPKDD